MRRLCPPGVACRKAGGICWGALFSVVPAVPLFAEILVGERVLVSFMDALPWCEDMEFMCGEGWVADEGGEVE